MKVTANRELGLLRLEFSGDGELDLHCAADVKAQAVALIDGASDVVFDLGGVSFVDSAGLGVLVGLYKNTRTHGRRARFIRVRPAVAHVMGVIKLDRIFDLHPDLAAAARSLARRSY